MSDVIDKEVRAPGNSVGPYSVTLKNVGSDNGKPIANSSFDLSYELWESSQTLTSNNLGEINFTIDDGWGNYTLQQRKVGSKLYMILTEQIEISGSSSGLKLINPKNNNSVELTEESSGWILTVKNTKIPTSPEPEPEPQPDPEGGTKMKVATDNSLKELIKLVKSQPSTSSGGILNVTLDYTIPSYSQVEVETKRKRVYADVPCVNSKIAMNAQITPNDNIENVSLLTYAEPFDGYIRCYFSEQPTEAYIIDSVELTPVTSIVKKNKKS